ncbi:MAG: hypothetical protein K8U03_15735 [Planctomycetia bacterium]|nr:hypothetical protein [Planctomycetia bacterium]
MRGKNEVPSTGASTGSIARAGKSDPDAAGNGGSGGKGADGIGIDDIGADGTGAEGILGSGGCGGGAGGKGTGGRGAIGIGAVCMAGSGIGPGISGGRITYARPHLSQSRFCPTSTVGTVMMPAHRGHLLGIQLTRLFLACDRSRPQLY